MRISGFLLFLLVAACVRSPDAAGDTAAATDSTAGPQSASTPWDAARTRGVDFRAIGQEPGWMLEIDEGKSMYLLADYGEKKVTTPASAPRDSAGVTIYEARAGGNRLTVHVRATACADVMSGESMTHTVTVDLNGVPYNGCGRDLRPSR
ncbi:MAG: hypothetical protein AB1762_10215 [Gemmatimonadota bacterium]